MAGGMLFLGQAVAQAEQANNVDQANTQTSTSEDGGGTTGNIGGNSNTSSNYARIEISTHVDGGAGGTNTSNVNTGIQGAGVVAGPADSGNSGFSTQNSDGPPRHPHSGDVTAELDIKTHSVSVEQNANGGNVSNSGNIHELPDLPDQTNNVRQVNTQTAVSEGDDHGWPKWHQKRNASRMGGHDEGLTGNLGGNHNESSNELYVDISTHVKGGKGGDNFSNVNTGVQLAYLACEAERRGDAHCEVDIETGSVKVVQNANGGSVSGSGNIGGGHHGDSHAPKGHGPHHKAAVSPAAAPAAKHAATAKAVSAAQPSKGQLASTGSDVFGPLALSLLALGLGGALSFAGRRRQTTTV